MKNLLKLTVVALSIFAFAQIEAFEYPRECVLACPAKNFSSTKAQYQCLNNCMNSFVEAPSNIND
jgi:hypothetical protein